MVLEYPVPKWGNRGKLARIAKRAIECDGILQQLGNRYLLMNMSNTFDHLLPLRQPTIL